MKRRERDILKASVSWTDKTLTVKEEKAFQAGAKWADKTMIEKACQWLIEKIDEDVLIKCGSVIKCIDAVEFSEYFRKAMEE